MLCLFGGVLAHGGLFAQEDFARAIAPWLWKFPRDHGRHVEFQTEWWYVTGNLASPEGRQFGCQLTFFRRAVSSEITKRRSAWAFRDIFASHFAISDLENNRFYYDQRAARGALGIADASNEGFDVHLQNWSMREVDGQIRLSASAGFGAIDLVLRNPTPPVLHGKQGLVKKGAQAGRASHYYSLPHLRTAGALSIGEKSFAISGVSWMDHEFGSSQLAPEDVGWDWFALHLPDGVDIMLYLLRRRDGSFAPYSAGSLMHGGRLVRHLAVDDFACKPVKWWESPQSGARYPVAWELRIHDYHLRIDAAFENQELDTRGTTRVIYWEGAVEISGTARGKAIGGNGYLEMTGYAPGSSPQF